MPVTRDDDKNAVEFTDLGVTMRTLLGYAAKGYEKTGRRVWTLLYNGVNVGKLQVRSNFIGKKDGNTNSGGTGVPKSTARGSGLGRKESLPDLAFVGGHQAGGDPDGASVAVPEDTPELDGQPPTE